VDRKTIQQLKAVCKCQIDVHLTTKREINFALYVFSKLLLEDQQSRSELVSLMSEMHALLSKMDISMVARLFESIRDRHVSLGEVLTGNGVIDDKAMETYLRGYRAVSGPLGDYLVVHGAITELQCQSALSSIDKRFSDLMAMYKEAVHRAAAA